MGQVYASLWCKSNFSFLEGASDPAELIEQAGHLGLRSIAITDRDGLYGVVQAHTAARQKGIHLIVGAEMTVVDPATFTEPVVLTKTWLGLPDAKVQPYDCNE